MFFIFWTGHKTHKTKIGSGRFVCPSCKTKQPFTRFSLASQLTLYSLIPVGKKKEFGQVVECNTCHEQFPASLLISGPSVEGDQGTVWVCQECHNVNPIDRSICLKCGHAR